MNLTWRQANTMRGTPLPKLRFVTRLKANRSLRREQSLIAFWCRRYWPIAALLMAYTFVGYVDEAYSADHRIALAQAETARSDKRLTDFLNGGALVEEGDRWAAKCLMVEVTR